MKGRIIDHPFYWHWFIVEIWNGKQFVQGPAFRSIDQVKAYLKVQTGRMEGRP